MTHTIQNEIERRLQKAFSPTQLTVVNFSAQHAGHAGVSGDTSGETHFRITLEADAFQGLSRVAAHRLIHTELADLMNAPIHALEVRVGKG